MLTRLDVAREWLAGVLVSWSHRLEEPAPDDPFLVWERDEAIELARVAVEACAVLRQRAEAAEARLEELTRPPSRESLNETIAELSRLAWMAGVRESAQFN